MIDVFLFNAVIFMFLVVCMCVALGIVSLAVSGVIFVISEIIVHISRWL